MLLFHGLGWNSALRVNKESNKARILLKVKKIKNKP